MSEPKRANVFYTACPGQNPDVSREVHRLTSAGYRVSVQVVRGASFTLPCGSWTLVMYPDGEEPERNSKP